MAVDDDEDDKDGRGGRTTATMTARQLGGRGDGRKRRSTMTMGEGRSSLTTLEDEETVQVV
jgi:hypothetical protein